jgi:tRNA-specific 2-thiouridylase
MSTISSQTKVRVMLSGGVDSSVALAKLQEQGYQVSAVFMKCWSEQQIQSLGLDSKAFVCSFEDDQKDAELVAKKLGVPFEVWNFESEYRNLVVDYMLQGYKQGITPNPDIMCNSFVKFGVFWDKLKKLESNSWVATGHYARMQETDNQRFLFRAKDQQKDQSYFLCRVSKQKLAQTLFPIGEFDSKAQVRQYAKQKGLFTSTKKDSQGLCFVGKVALSEMLLQVLGKKTGDILELSTNQVLGQHKGAFLYTIGQRQGLGLSGGPWFVAKVDIDSNKVFVVNDEQSQNLETHTLTATSCNWLVDNPQSFPNLTAQIRYRQQAQNCTLEVADNLLKVNFEEPVRAVAKGQSVVVYSNDMVLGGGIIV